MTRPIARLALVALTVLVATGPSALALADAPGSAAAVSEGATAADPGVTTAVEPLDEPDGANATDGNVTDDGLPDENLTDDSNDETTDVNLTDETTDETLTNASDDPNETTAVVDETAETVVNEIGNATDSTNATTDIGDSNATAELDGAVADGTDATENATNVTDGVNATDVIDGANDIADGVGTIDAATRNVTAVNAERVSFESAASRLSSVGAADVADPSGEDGDADDAESDDEGPASGAPADSGSATERDDGTETTTAAGTGEAGTAAVGGSDSDRSPDPRSGAAPSGIEAVAGVGALTAAALFPHFADGVSLAGDARALSAPSATASSRLSFALRGEFDRLWRFATAFRYSRYDDSDPLDHETRARLHETVERSPGAYLSAVCERADVAVSTARHHLDVLEDEGLVTTAKVRGKRRYFPAHSDDVELAAALEDAAAAEVLRALARLGDSHGGRLADELDRDPSTVSHHLSRLEDAGLVEREREGQAVVNRLAPEVRARLGDETDEDGDATGETPAIAD